MSFILTNYRIVGVVFCIIVIQIAFTRLNGTQFTCYGDGGQNCPKIMSDCFGYGVSERAFKEAKINDKNCMINRYWRHSPAQFFLSFGIFIGLVFIFYKQKKWLDETGEKKDEKKDEKISIFVLSIFTSISLVVSLIIGGDISLIISFFLIIPIIRIIYDLYKI
jgi:hypothetical protein